MSRKFYKATRPDGTDFYSGTIEYKVGATVKPNHHDGVSTLCGPGLLHAATVATETMVTGSWPCRLFVVTGKPVAGLNQSHPHKAGFKQLYVAEEIEAHEVFGPQGIEVVSLIQRAEQLTLEEVLRAPAARSAAGSAAGSAARSAARSAAGSAAGSALAIVTRDLITEKQYEILTKPWNEITNKEGT